jgi:hypothetical protein
MGYQCSPTNSDGVLLNPSTIEPESKTDVYGSYDCSHADKRGKLILNALGVSFISSIGHKRHFSLPYENIEELEKVCRKSYAAKSTVLMRK